MTGAIARFGLSTAALIGAILAATVFGVPHGGSATPPTHPWVLTAHSTARNGCATSTWTSSNGATFVVSGDGPFTSAGPSQKQVGPYFSAAASVSPAQSAKTDEVQPTTCSSVVQDAIAVGMNPSMAYAIFGQFDNSAAR